jgi:hypothetical protein
MQLNTGRSQLYGAIKGTAEHWEEVKRVWRDAVRADFEENCFLPLQQQVNATLRAIDRLAVIASQMQQECE